MLSHRTYVVYFVLIILKVNRRQGVKTLTLKLYKKKLLCLSVIRNSCNTSGTYKRILYTTRYSLGFYMGVIY